MPDKFRHPDDFRAPDKLDRAAFYGDDAAEEDDEEYELAPPDPEVLAAEKRRSEQVAEAAMLSVDVDEIYRETGPFSDYELPKVRFQIKHLLIATALFALALTIGQIFGWGFVVFLTVIGAAGGGLIYFNRVESRQKQCAAERQRQMHERQRKFREAQVSAGDAVPADTTSFDDAWPDTPPDEPSLRFTFTLREMMVAVTIAALIFGLVSFLEPGPTALLLGMIALLGLVVEAIGYDAPRVVMLGWWLLLVLYIVISVVAAVLPSS